MRMILLSGLVFLYANIVEGKDLPKWTYVSTVVLLLIYIVAKKDIDEWLNKEGRFISS
jgi:pantothenate kinase